MMGLGNFPGIIQLEPSSQRLSDLKKKIHADRKICCVNKANTGRFNHSTYFGDFSVPAGGAYHEVFPAVSATGDVIHHRVGSGEVDHHINLAESLGSQSCPLSIFIDINRSNPMFTCGGKTLNEGSHLAAAEKK